MLKCWPLIQKRCALSTLSNTTQRESAGLTATALSLQQRQYGQDKADGQVPRSTPLTRLVVAGSKMKAFQSVRQPTQPTQPTGCPTSACTVARYRGCRQHELSQHLCTAWPAPATHPGAATGLRPGFRRRAKNACSVGYSLTGFSAADASILKVYSACAQTKKLKKPCLKHGTYMSLPCGPHTDRVCTLPRAVPPTDTVS